MSFRELQEDNFDLILKVTYPNYITRQDKYEHCGDAIP